MKNMKMKKYNSLEAFKTECLIQEKEIIGPATGTSVQLKTQYNVFENLQLTVSSLSDVDLAFFRSLLKCMWGNYPRWLLDVR